MLFNAVRLSFNCICILCSVNLVHFFSGVVHLTGSLIEELDDEFPDDYDDGDVDSGVVVCVCEKNKITLTEEIFVAELIKQIDASVVYKIN